MKTNNRIVSVACALCVCTASLFGQEQTPSPAQKKVYVRDVAVKGTVNTNAGLITANFALKKGDRYSAKDVQESIHTLYNLGLFADISIEAISLENDSFTLVITMKEHPILDKVQFSGNDEIDTKDLEEKVNILSGTVISPSVVQKAKNQVADLYTEKGFLLAEISPKTYESKETGKTILEFEIKEGKKVKVKEIRIKGAVALKEKKIKKVIENTKEDRWWRSGDYNEDKFFEDMKRIEAYYNTEGFLDAKVQNWDVSYSDDKKNMYITIDIFEGTRYFLGNVVFTGNEIFDDKILIPKMTLKRGDLFNNQEYEISKFNLQSLYREDGYLYISLQDEKTYRKDTVDIIFRLKEGMPAYINRVIINGNTKTWDKVVRREIALHPGDIYSQSQMMLSQRDILQTNYFDQATPDVRPNDDGSIDLVMNVQEKESGTGQVSASAGYSQRDGFILGASLSMPNFSITRPFMEGAGQSVDLQLEYGKYSKRYDVGFTEPWFMDTPTLLGFRGFYWWRDWQYNAIEERRKGGEIRVGRRLRWPDPYFKVYSTYDVSLREYLQDGLIMDDDFIQGTVIKNSGIESALSLTLTRNSTDLPDFPTKGSVVEYSPSISGYFLGGEYKYIKHRFSAQLYLPVFWQFVYSQAINFSHLNGSIIGRYDHFLAGGVNYEGVIRGYPDRSFGDLVMGEHVGYNLAVFSSELRFPIMERRLYLGVFADFGNTWAQLRDINFADLKTGVGTGVKLLVPMLGLIGFDVAWGLNDYPEPGVGSDSYGNVVTHEQKTGEKPPYFEFHFRFGKPF
ncbi:MAG: outer membrane protein assembly factor BamA [Candidatus Raymondbacteria bacterium RifOxyA12_full_50_37]|uniref:Outer membrane protein assembly factor BamA n=1 Tax=Candidatus Raymondbacteria bacterium RIFOXYD12_FULL_49_13 TaxID=1817890 RepID=A0A1F7FIE0_UNCRA|nr:MAG: outer membrane protein assembly factor BamA [Candidatus Raymondbacteria bacterium RifOxyB12_full_50_8]OGJ91760.1 MAG: outer membrane protein assembly factor BamA [Candidatus Raymondbacteria bacterium RifOxyA12_full_50_37]OGJ93520.1 MAG: outer membrane protein assembly factor BamA [Candidatus Raymondbacteria bacterium RIFOXYA2_FULL_49_16]OGJ96986.1 MAG: outer membrane protein assembly factor BamA [Candidatus Raymondbacteria bacterium RifOxyC12_full_50_8]OGJ98790.1 MAG: outer membrane pro